MLNVGVCIFGVYLVVYARQGRGKELLNIFVVQVCVFCVLLQGLWSSKFVRNDNQRKKNRQSRLVTLVVSYINIYVVPHI